MPARIRPATTTDAQALARLAAITFPLACPADCPPDEIAAFIETHLTAAHFEEYLADPNRVLFLAEEDSEQIGYTMVIMGEPTDAEAAAAITLRPTAELSKCYVHPDHHGAGVAAALVDASVEVARAAGAAGMWLGVNEENARANRFYEKHGFERVGVKHFTLGERIEDDYVRQLKL